MQRDDFTKEEIELFQRTAAMRQAELSRDARLRALRAGIVPPESGASIAHALRPEECDEPVPNKRGTGDI